MSMFICLIGLHKRITQERYYAAPHYAAPHYAVPHYAAPHYAVPFVLLLPFTFPLLGFSFLSGAFT